MAGNKMTTKNKGKEDKSKGGKIMPQTGEDNDDPDFSILRKPVQTSITGFAQARKIFDFGTEEVKGLLANECDLLYECKVCRNIFRSLVNFISHKRIYCQEKFSSTIHGHFIDPTSTLSEILKLKRIEKEYQESLRNKNAHNKDKEEGDRIPMSKDLTEVIEKIAKVKGGKDDGGDTVSLQKISTSSVAVFQNVNAQAKDNMRKQVNELESMVSRDKAVMQSDGTFRVESSGEHVIQISDDDDDEERVLKCRICDLQFSTQKTLKFHMKNKHVESRLVYPCPDCLEIFSTSWSVYRHLFKVHRKTAAQIRRLRESIQAKAFRMNNPPAFYEKRKPRPAPAPPSNTAQDHTIHQENQAWMENLESAGEGACCGGCGRAFERRAALLAHTHTCHPRTRALARDTRTHLPARRDCNKPPHALSILKNDPPAPENITTKTSTEQVQPEKKKEDQETDDKDVEEEKDPLADAPMDLEEEQSNDSVDSPEKLEQNSDLKPVFRLPFAMQAEKSNLAAFRQRVHPDTDLSKLLCKKCDTTHSTATDLYKHMADHYKWMRYACKLCNYKHYNYENLPEHVRIVHKLKGDTDFYFSTVKAIDGTDAMILSRCLVESENTDENNEPSETSPESRRPSRCSSDSSRLSDDSSSSSNFKETGSRKRKMYQAKTSAKKKKEVNNAEQEEEPKEGSVSLAKVLKSIIGGKESPLPVKGFEENSSDIDDLEDKITKKTTIADKIPAASRRPVRKRTRPKNEDFEYDLSNLLKLEAQGYRDSRTEVPPPKPAPTKKKVQQESQVVFDINKDYVGALFALSKKAVEVSAAHMKTHFTLIPVQRASNVFARPMLPKILARGEKISPRKDVEDAKDNSSPNKVSKADNVPPPANKDSKLNNKSVEESMEKFEIVNVQSLLNENSTDKKGDKTEQTPDIKVASTDTNATAESSKNDSKSVREEKTKSKMNISALVPLKFRRQSLDLMKNPIINKNISDFTKAGMKTKVLVIKPINRNKDGTPNSTSSLKFQTIKLKEPSNLGLNNDESKQSDQVVVVKVPKVDCGIPRSVSEPQVTNCEKIVPETTSNNTDFSSVSDNVNIDNNTENEIVNIESTRPDTLEEAVCHELDDISECNIDEPQNEVNDTDISPKVIESVEIVETA